MLSQNIHPQINPSFHQRQEQMCYNKCATFNPLTPDIFCKHILRLDTLLQPSTFNAFSAPVQSQPAQNFNHPPHHPNWVKITQSLLVSFNLPPPSPGEQNKKSPPVRAGTFCRRGCPR